MTDKEDPRSVWPNLFIVGAAKAGTNSLYTYLGQHPEIFMSPEKEPHFFSRVWTGLDEVDEEELAPRRQAYLDLFEEGASFPYRGEASVSYLWDPDAARRIHDVQPDARIVISLRDPVERAYSHYLMDRRQGREPEASFLDAIEADLAEEEKAWDGTRMYVEPGRYAAQLERYLDRFGEDQVLVFESQNLRDEKRRTLEQILTFLDVDLDPLDEIAVEQDHYTYKPPRNPLAGWLRSTPAIHKTARVLLPGSIYHYLFDHLLVDEGEKPPMSEAARERLEEIYAPEIEALEELLGRSLPSLTAGWETSYLSTRS